MHSTKIERKIIRPKYILFLEQTDDNFSNSSWILVIHDILVIDKYLSYQNLTEP